MYYRINHTLGNFGLPSQTVHRLALTLALLLIAVEPPAQAGDASPRPLVGAIRWDAWHAPRSNAPLTAIDPATAMERSLGPKPYHYRVPFFATIVSDNEVKIGGYTQSIVDQEIGFARAGGLDYWAFLLYGTNDPMNQALQLYLSSKRKQDIHFCAIGIGGALGDQKHFPDRMQRIIKLMSEPSYQKVAGNRPLLYLYNVTDDCLKGWGGPENTRRLFDEFRSTVKAADHGDPYLVVMDFHPPRGQRVAQAIGAEAISSYATQRSGEGAPYAELAGAAHSFWDQCAHAGAQVVPIVMAGWDRRPRIEHPVPWEKEQKPGVGMEKYYQMPTPQQLTAHLVEAMQWVREKQAQCPAQTVIVYAWNEHDEGGWLCPTLNPDGSPNTERLDAIAVKLKEWRVE